MINNKDCQVGQLTREPRTQLREKDQPQVLRTSALISKPTVALLQKEGRLEDYASARRFLVTLQTHLLYSLHYRSL